MEPGDAQRSLVLYNRLKRRFSGIYGAPAGERTESDYPEATAMRTAAWNTAGHYVLVSRTDRRVAWGAQDRRPY